ncbi:MFS transporter [Endozoicomonadaceae bacterium StTr2]
MLRFISPLSGLAIFAIASGYLMTLIPLRINHISEDSLLAGYLGGIYYLGLLAGSFRSEHTVMRVGHIRSYAAFMALLCSATLGLGLFDSTWAWLGLRFISGLSVAGIFVAIESWLLCESTAESRGRILAIYMVALYGSNALGQAFVSMLDPTSLLPFILIGAFFSLSILPPALTKIPSPEIEAASSLNIIKLLKLTPSAMIGCLAGGLILGALYSLLPIQLLNDTQSSSSVSMLLAVTMLGGMLLQYPTGHFSDYVDRRKVLVAISAIGSLCCLAYIWVNSASWMGIVLLFLIGGTTFTLYPLAISHGCDHLQPEDIVAGTQGLLLGYSSGACLGPVIAGYFMQSMEHGLMLYFATIMGLIALFFFIRIPFRPQIYSSDEQPFIPVPRTTPVVAQIDPRGDIETEPTSGSTEP